MDFPYVYISYLRAQWTAYNIYRLKKNTGWQYEGIKLYARGLLMIIISLCIGHCISWTSFIQNMAVLTDEIAKIIGTWHVIKFHTCVTER